MDSKRPKTEIGFVSTAFDESGIGRYSQEVFSRLCDRAGETTSVKKVLINGEKQQIEKENTTLSVDLPVPTNDMLFGYIATKLGYLGDRYDMYHLALQSLSFLPIEPKVVTCHDLIKVYEPESWWRRLPGKVYYSGLSSAEQLIAVSESTKNDLLDRYSVSEGKVTTVYNGVSSEFEPADESKASVRRELGLDPKKKIVLYVGSEERRKNVPRIIDAVRNANEVLSEEVLLLKVGSPGRKGNRERIEELIRSHGLTHSVQFIGHVSNKELVKYFNASDLFVYPSLYEGFGLPPLEALACGVPVVTSNVSSLPEVVGDAAYTVDPLDTTALFEAVVEALRAPNERSTISDRIKQASKFSWERCVEQTIQVYEQCPQCNADSFD